MQRIRGVEGRLRDFRTRSSKATSGKYYRIGRNSLSLSPHKWNSSFTADRRGLTSCLRTARISARRSTRYAITFAASDPGHLGLFIDDAFRQGILLSVAPPIGSHTNAQSLEGNILPNREDCEGFRKSIDKTCGNLRGVGLRRLGTAVQGHDSPLRRVEGRRDLKLALVFHQTVGMLLGFLCYL